MQCCSDVEVQPSDRITECPSCGRRGRLVKAITLDSLMRAGHPRTDKRYRFCGSAGCDVAWFGEGTGHQIPTSASRVRIGQKQTSADRQLCYCFGYTTADIDNDVRTTGVTHIGDTIKAHCRRGEDRCPQTNPQGSCCLGDVRAATKLAMARHGQQPSDV